MHAGNGALEQLIVAPAERRPAVLRIIDAARDRLDLSLFRCDDEPVVDAIGRAAGRGVRVRALVTGRAKGSKAQLKQLRKALARSGADVRTYGDAVVRYHAKYLVADDGPALVASLNFTQKCFGPTCDFMLVSTDPRLVDALRLVFEADWDGTGLPPAVSGDDRLIVGPEHARARLAALLAQATSRIRLIDPKVSDPAMLALLKARAAQGVHVDLRAASGLGALAPHGKLLLIDDRAAVVGSMSLSTLSLEFRRELAVLVVDRASLDVLDRFWASLPPPEPAGTPAAGSVEPAW